MIDLFRPFMAPDVPATVARVLTPDANGRLYVGEGELVKQFEQTFGALVDSPYAPLAMSSCTTALEMALYLAGVRAGSEVISTPMTCTATSAAIVRSGARIVWADVDPITGLIDPDDVARKATIDTRAIVAVDWGGRSCDYDALCGSARVSGRALRIPIIQDAAHSLLTQYQGSSIARSGGDYVCWSFGPIKHLTCGGHGGALLAPSHHHERARLLRWYGLDRQSKADFRCEQDVIEPGWKAHLTDVDAAIGLANLPSANGIVWRHRDNAGFYADAFEGLDGVTVPPFDYGSAYWIFDLLVDDRDSFQRYLTERGIMSSRVHRRNDEHPGYHFPSGPLPGVDAFDSRHICIPVGWWVSTDEREQITEAVVSWARSRVAVA